MWLLLAMVISISYTGNLVAYITVPGKPQRLATLKELAESSFTPSMVDYGNFVPAALRSSQDPVFSALGRRMELVPNYGYDLGFQQVREGTHAFLEGTEYFRYLVILYHMAATTYFMPETVYPVHVGWIYPKNTPWKHKFDPYLQAFVESGLCHYWKKLLVADFLREMNESLQNEPPEPPVRALSLQDLQGAFLIYGLSLLTALLLGLLELLCQP
ncbi:Glutamate receptor ionotropic, delta-2-like 10, partial [Homarus americanus]